MKGFNSGFGWGLGFGVWGLGFGVTHQLPSQQAQRNKELVLANLHNRSLKTTICLILKLKKNNLEFFLTSPREFLTNSTLLLLITKGRTTSDRPSERRLRNQVSERDPSPTSMTSLVVMVRTFLKANLSLKKLKKVRDMSLFRAMWSLRSLSTTRNTPRTSMSLTAAFPCTRP